MAIFVARDHRVPAGPTGRNEARSGFVPQALALYLLGWGPCRTVIHRVVDRDLFISILATFGISVLLQQVMNLIFTTEQYLVGLAIGTLAGGLAAAGVAVVLGSGVLGLRGHYFAIGTLGLGIAAGEITAGWDYIGAGAVSEALLAIRGASKAFGGIVANDAISLDMPKGAIVGPSLLLVDEPSIGLEPRFIDMVFEILDDLQRNEGKTIVIVEQNARKGLEFADIGYVLVSGRLAKAGPGEELLADADVGRLFPGG